MGYIDVHSHVLPGLDDGSRSMEQSLEMLRIAHSEGIEIIIATPHNMPGKGQPSREKVLERIENLQKEAHRAGISVKILMGTEYFYREEVPELLEDGKGIGMNGSEYVLVEFDPMVESRYFCNALQNIMGAGYRPIVAHVERYAKVMDNPAVLKDLKRMGVLLQVNAASVIGDNGRGVKKDVKKLLKEHLVDFVGTDAHSDGRGAPRMEKCATYLAKKYGGDYAWQLLCSNAGEYFGI